MSSIADNRRAVFLDRDGTINRDVGYTHRESELEFLPNAVAGLARMAALGLKLLITTNQSGVARGYFPETDVYRFHEALLERLRAEGIKIDGVYFCPFHPTEGLGAYRRESPLRKPADGMLRRAAAEHSINLASSFAIGDRMSDVAAGQAAGCRTILVHTGNTGAEPANTPPHFVARDLLDAARFIERILDETNQRSPAAEATARGLHGPSERKSA